MKIQGVGFAHPGTLRSPEHVGKAFLALAIGECSIDITQMFNVISILIGIVALLLAIPSSLPFLGWANWFVLPIAVIGAGIGALSSSNGGRNFCLVVFVIAVIRLMLGGGIF